MTELNVEFISYNGEYPNLCSGALVLNVNGKEYMFKDHSLYSGGSVSFDKEWNEHVTEGNWHVMEWPEGFPESAKEAALELINEKIRHGCCGGCI